MKVSSVVEAVKVLKQQHPDCMVMFLIGDFYELFFDDATTAASVLGLAVTTMQKRQANVEPISMVGFPKYCGPDYIEKLVAAGHKVAVCERIESGKKVGKVRRLIIP